MASHSALSPSKAHRYLQCPGSIVLEAGHPEDDGNEYTAEGTAAHELAAICLQENRNADAYLGRVFVVDAGGKKYEFEVDDDMAKHVQSYVNYVLQFTESLIDDPILLVEHRVNLSYVLGPDEGGTADAIVFTPAEGRLDVIDLKYGQGVRVDAVDNPQALLYALGAMGEYPGKVHEVVVHIAQPRLGNFSTATYTRDQMVEFLKRAKEGAKRVGDAVDAAGSLDKISREEWQTLYLSPSADACKFCKAKGTCPSLAKEAIATVSGRTRAEVNTEGWEDFTAPSKEHVNAAGNATLGTLRSKIDMIETWIKAVVSEVDARLARGEEVPGWKQVKGNRAAPQWTNKDEAEALLKSFRLRKEEMYNYTIINAAAARKLVTEPRRKKKLEALIRETGGLPTTVPVSDPRPALQRISKEEDFEDLTG